MEEEDGQLRGLVPNLDVNDGHLAQRAAGQDHVVRQGVSGQHLLENRTLDLHVASEVQWAGAQQVVNCVALRLAHVASLKRPGLDRECRMGTEHIPQN